MYFKKKIKKNQYYRECPVCGKFEYLLGEEGNYPICNSCGWKNVPIGNANKLSGVNHMSLNSYKKQYAKFISTDPNYIWSRGPSIPFYVGTMKIDVNKVKKIEYSHVPHIINEYSSATDITALVDFFNSFELKELYACIDCQRPCTDITIYYKDGKTENIVYEYTSLFYRGTRYKIDFNKTFELDRLLNSYVECSQDKDKS